ncbi:MAG: ferritin [Candidatus Melainabacteria bacterium HGW-Melainabacteria-1]|nr:MAG: ferritin [Candidatus Melainabacteria bacterium HGW-Melainabacteria-1]
MFKFKFFAMLALLGSLSACSTLSPNQNNASATPTRQGSPLASKNPFVQVDSSGSTRLIDNLLNQALAQMPKSELSEAEKTGLLQMREEEKLAQDVYLSLAGLWPQARQFQNISGSEASHTESVRQLLERYQIIDPALKETGKFSSVAMQNLYDSLTTQGKTSLIAALQVGLEIEELDIADLQTLSKSIDQEDIRLVYQELERGSRNHLRAFHNALKTAGGTYKAKHLSQSAFDAIATSAVERGSGG